MQIPTFQDIRQTPEYAHFMKKIGWTVYTSEVKDKDTSEVKYIFIKKLPLLSLSVVKVLRYQPPLDSVKLKSIIKNHNPILTKLEPLEIEKKDNSLVYFKLFKKTGFPLTPTKTLWIDLTKKESQLLKEMKPKTRYNLKKAQKHSGSGRKDSPGVKNKVIIGNKITTKQLESFYRLWSRNKPHDWFFKPSFYELSSLIGSFKNKCFFVSCLQGDALQAGSLILTSKNMAFYWHNCSTKEGKKLFAPTLCTWEAIKESQKRKLKVFDFEGIWDERYPKLNQGWKGFTRFKLGFTSYECRNIIKYPEVT